MTSRVRIAAVAIAWTVAACNGRGVGARPDPRGAARDAARTTNTGDGSTEPTIVRADAPGDAGRSDSLEARAMPVGLTHEQLMALYYPDGGSDATNVLAPGARVEPDRAWSDETPCDVTRSTWAMTLPDERGTLTVERTMRLDANPERTRATFIGAGAPVQPGTTFALRGDSVGFATWGAGAQRYSVVDADGLRREFTGSANAPRGTLAFHSSGTTTTVTRDNAAVVFTGDAGAPVQPLACELWVAMLLGGDPARIRTGCRESRGPSRVILRAGSTDAWVFERRTSEAVQLPRRAMAFPPDGATATPTPDARPTDAAFFAPQELARLGGQRSLSHTLVVANESESSAWVFVDDLALGWVGPARTVQFVGLSAGDHSVRVRSLDGRFRPRAITAEFPARVTIDANTLRRAR